MKVYDCSEARDNLEALMDEAWMAGYVKIRQRVGRDFMLRPWELRSPLEELEVSLEVERLVQDALALARERDGSALSVASGPENGKAA